MEDFVWVAKHPTGAGAYAACVEETDKKYVRAFIRKYRARGSIVDRVTRDESARLLREYCEALKGVTA
jgi:hypothetical protein